MESLAELYDRLAERVRGSIHRDTRDYHVAEDLMQEAFIRIGPKLPHPDPATLLALIVSGLVKNWYRDQGRRPEFVEYMDDRLPRGGFVPNWPAYDFGQRLDGAVRALDTRSRDAFILTTIRGLSQDEAGAVLGISQRAVGKRLAAATDFVREDVN